jgi:hypothetical protein
MYKLSAQNVKHIFSDCNPVAISLYKDMGYCSPLTTETLDIVILDLITKRYSFKKEPLKKNKIFITHLVSGLPQGFRWDQPYFSGQPFRLAKFDYGGEEWANSPEDIENLFALAICAGVMVPLLKERALWKSFLINDPYFVVTSYYRPENLIKPITYSEEKS